MLKSVLKPIVKALLDECLEEYLKDSGERRRTVLKAVSKIRGKKIDLSKLYTILDILGSIDYKEIAHIDFAVVYCDSTRTRSKKVTIRGKTPVEFLSNLKKDKQTHLYFKEALLFLSYNDKEFGTQSIHQSFLSSFDNKVRRSSDVDIFKEMIVSAFEEYPELLV